MGIKIQMVDYSDMRDKAKEMYSYGENLESDFTGSYSEISDMRDNWYGKRYDSLVDDFNEMLASVNSIIKLVVYQIPEALKEIATNYIKANQDTYTISDVYDLPLEIGDLSKTNKTNQVKFIFDEVKSTQQTVNSKLDDAINEMDQIDSQLTSLEGTWAGDAASAFRKTFDTLKGDVKESISNIQTDFETLMNGALEDMNAAETNNTVTLDENK